MVRERQDAGAKLRSGDGTASKHCLLDLSHCASFSGVHADVHRPKEEAANFNVAALRYGQPSLFDSNVDCSGNTTERNRQSACVLQEYNVWRGCLTERSRNRTGASLHKCAPLS